MQPVLDDILDTWGGRNGWLGILRAFLDDGVCSRPIPVLLEVLKFLQSPEVKARGLDMRLDKCGLYVPYQGVVDVPSIKSLYGIPAEMEVSTRGCVILGCPVSVNEVFIAEHLQALVCRVETYNQQVMSLASPQVALALLRLCAGPTKVAHILRCLPPDLTSALAEAVDASTRNSLLGIMKVEDMSPLQ